MVSEQTLQCLLSVADIAIILTFIDQLYSFFLAKGGFSTCVIEAQNHNSTLRLLFALLTRCWQLTRDLRTDRGH